MAKLNFDILSRPGRIRREAAATTRRVRPSRTPWTGTALLPAICPGAAWVRCATGSLAQVTSCGKCSNMKRKVSHFIGLAIIAAFLAYPVIRYGLDALESTAIVFF